MAARGLNLAAVKVISFDITGTLFVHRYPISQTYAECAIRARLPNPPTMEQIRQPFKDAFKEMSIEYPQYGGALNMSDREWWKKVVRKTLDLCGTNGYSEEAFKRYFRRVYQFYGSPEAYELLNDADELLKWLAKGTHKKYSLGITTNAPLRSVETMLPMTGIDRYFDWFVCCRDVLADKPSPIIFDDAFKNAQFWYPGVERNEVLHIGDSWTHDYCGARAAGFQALCIDRTDLKVVKYHDWLNCPDYPNKSESDRENHTFKNLIEVKNLLIESQVSFVPIATMYTNSVCKE